MLKLNEKIGDTIVELNFEHKVNVLLDDSGTGKTFMFQLLCAYCSVNEIPHIYFDYKSAGFKKETFWEESKEKQFVFFDNADLYLSTELLSQLKELEATIVLSVKNIELVDVDEDTGIYYMEYDGITLASKGGVS